MTTVAGALVAALRRHEVATVFGQSLPTMVMLAAERAGIRQIVYRTENAGGAMADGFARVSGRVGVVASQNGPAAALLVAPLAEALKASSPVVALVQDVPRFGRERNGFQEFDHRQLFSACAKWIGEVPDPTRVDDYVDAAFRHAVTGRPGPTVLLLPKDFLREEVPDAARRRSASLGRYPVDRPTPEVGATRQAAALIAGAPGPSSSLAVACTLRRHAMRWLGYNRTPRSRWQRPRWARALSTKGTLYRWVPWGHSWVCAVWLPAAESYCSRPT